MIFCLLVHVQFSYSTTFSTHVYLYMIMFKAIYVLLDQFVLYPILYDHLFFGAIGAATHAISNMTVMGATCFTNFILSSFGRLFITITERLYVLPFFKYLVSMTPWWVIVIRRWVRGKTRITRDQKAREELEWRKVNEELEMLYEGIEPMLESYHDYAIDTVALILTPLLFYCTQLFFIQTQIPTNYLILPNQMIYYIVYRVIYVPFQLLCDIFLLNACELIFGWKIYDYIAYQRYRFSVREYRWILRNNIFDESISESLQKVDLLCFSSQFYYLVGLMGYGMILIVLGVTIIITQNYNPLGDPVLLLLILTTFFVCEVIGYILVWLGTIQVRRIGWRGLWVTKLVEGTVDDDVAGKNSDQQLT